MAVFKRTAKSRIGYRSIELDLGPENHVAKDSIVIEHMTYMPEGRRWSVCKILAFDIKPRCSNMHKGISKSKARKLLSGYLK